MNLKIIESQMNRFLEETKDKSFFGMNGNRLIEKISLGVQSASHPYFKKLPVIIKGHLKPIAFFAEEHARSFEENLSVVSIALHYEKSIVIGNSKESEYPSYLWYEMTDKFFNEIFEPLEKQIHKLFKNNNVLFPSKPALYHIGGSERIRLANWSERHIAFGCGMGSFGLNGALITAYGCTLRLISFITDAKFDEYNEPLEDIYANCLYYQEKECGKCIGKCPVDSITAKKRIIENCYQHEYIESKEKAIEIYGKGITACGLCMSGVPCSFTNPMKEII